MSSHLAGHRDGDEMRGNFDEYARIDNIPARFRFPVIQGRPE